MHPPILEVRPPSGRAAALAVRWLGLGLALATGAAAGGRLPTAAPDPNCPARATALVEHFVGADCAECWGATPDGTRVPGAQEIADGAWSLDWIAPAAGGADDPALPEALPESVERLARLDPHLPARLQAPPAGFDTLTELTRPGAGHRFAVHSSLPFKGYFGVQMHASGTWPAGATGWIALVEGMRPDTAGSVVERRVVRAVKGPLALPTAPGARNEVAPLFAMRWPETARPERVMATAWVEAADGRILQITSDRCPDPASK